MTSGARLDTNSQWLSRRLEELGVTVAFHSTVGDHLQQHVDVLRIAAQRADVVLMTGGLGPTRDDLTRQALSQLSGRALKLRQQSLVHIEQMFARRNRQMPERNHIQAMFPEGSLEIFNPQGTAPGVDLTLRVSDRHKCRFFALPGVPAEMRRMFDETVAPRLLEMIGSSRQHIEHHVMKFFGVGESDMEQRLGTMIARDRVPRVGITVSSATISLRITAAAPDPQACQRQIETARQEIMSRVGDLYFGHGESYELYHAVQRDLLMRGQSLITVEFGRSAVLADWFASLGKTDAYHGGFCFAGPEELAALLDVPAADAYDVLRKRSGASWLLVVQSYPHLDSDASQALEAQSVDLVVVDPEGRRILASPRIGGHPSIIYSRIAKSALAHLRKQIQRGDQLQAESEAAIS